MRIGGVFFTFASLAFSACVGDSTGNPDASPHDSSTDETSAPPVDSGGGDADAGAWDPSQIKGLALWLNGDLASKNVNGTIDTWKDSSPNHNDAKQTTTANQPLLLTGAQGISGHQAIHFDGSKMFMTLADAPTLQWSKSFVLEIVLRDLSTNALGGPAYAKRASNYVGVDMYLNVNVVELDLAAGVATSVTVSPDGGVGTGAHRIRGAFDLTSLTLSAQIDVQPPVTKTLASAVGGVDAVGTNAGIGWDGSGYFTGDIAEIVAVAADSVDPADVVKLQAYLDAKYGL